MEGEPWKQLYHLLRSSGKGLRRKREQYCEARVVAVYLWAVVHDRPVSCACKEGDWPDNPDRALPGVSRMSRRLRTDSVRDLLKELEQVSRDLLPSGLWKWIDAKLLPAWVRTHPRVEVRVRCKIVIYHLHKARKSRLTA